MSVATIAVVWAAEADRVRIPVADIFQSSPPVMATVVPALLLPIKRVSAVVFCVAMFIGCPVSVSSNVDSGIC